MNDLSPRLFQGAKGKAGAKKAKSPVVAPDSLQSRAMARVVDVVSEGQIGGLLNDLKSVFFEGTPVQNADGTFNFQGVTIDQRFGTSVQSPVLGFANVESEFVVNTQITKASPVTRTIADTSLDAVRVKIRIPQLQLVDNTGNIKPTSIQVAVDLQSDGGSFAEVLTDTISGKCSSPYEREYRINLPPGGAPWSVRMRRITDDSGSQLLSNDSYWSTYTEVIDSKLSYPNVAYFAITVNSEEFGDSIPVRAYEIAGILCQVPMNYDPDTRVYATTGPGTSGGIWDGSFKRAVTDNPAWILYDLLTEKRYALGDEIPVWATNKDALYEIAQYCDELVPDGKGGTEPRYTFNGVINTQEQAFNVLRSVASAFRGALYWGAGAVVATQDAPSDAVRLITPANVIDGTFTYEESDELVRHSVALVSWNDPADGFNTAVEVVEDPVALASFGYRPIEVAAYGCTSQGLAHRLGKWTLDTEQHEFETCSWRASYDQANLKPGQIVKIADPAFAQVRFGGRVKSATTTEVVVDAAVNLVPTGLPPYDTYTLAVVLPNGSIEERTVTNPLGSTDTLTVASAYSQAPLPEAMWIISSSAVQPRTFRVITIKEADNHLYDISALFHDPTKYPRVEQNITLPPPNYSSIPTGPLAAPQNLSIREYLYQVGSTVFSAVSCAWMAPNDSRVISYEIEAQRPGDPNFYIKDATSDKSVEVTQTVDGDFSFRVRSLDGIGRRSAWSIFTGTLQAFGLPPADVTNFKINILGETAYLSWDAVPDLDLDHYRIKYSPVTSGATWGSSSDLLPKVSGTSVQVPALIGTYLIKAVDTSLVESVNATILEPTVQTILDFDVTETVTESPGFSGTKTGCEVDGTLGGLRITDVSTDSGVAIYEFATTVDLGNSYTSRLSVQMTAGGVDLDSDWFAPVDWFSSSDVFNSDPSDWHIDLEMRATNDDPGGSPVAWSEWQPLIVGDYTARGYQFRAHLYSHQAGTTPLISGMSITVNMPDRVAADKDIVSGAGASVISFAPAFKSLKGLVITPHNMATGDYYEVTSKSALGFTVTFKNAAGTIISRTYDYTAKGYGFVV